MRERHPNLLAADIELPPNWHSNVEFSHEAMFKLFINWNVSDVESEIQLVQKITPGTVILPLVHLGASLGHIVLVDPVNWQQFDESSIFASYFNCFVHHLDQALAYYQIEHMTFKDDLTDLYNQRYLPIVLDQEMQRAARQKNHFSVLFLDVDFFKMVNDTKGHLVGSNVLVQISKLIKDCILGTDFAFRYGGDEYVIVLSDAASADATIVAERLRKRTEATVFTVGEAQVKVTVSIGIATYPEHARTTAELLQMADDAMYKGKHKSRNIVYLAS
jgi:two-component system cell cycle response regulator